MSTLLAAVAALLPLTTVYGTPDACIQFAQNGPDGVLYGEPDAGGADVLLVRPQDALTKEGQCVPDSGSLGLVNFTCEGGDQEWSFTATLSLKGEVLHWQDEDGTLELHPCPADAIM